MKLGREFLSFAVMGAIGFVVDVTVLYLAALLAVGAIALVIPLLITYLHTGLVPRLPTAVLATGAMLAAMLSMVCGVVMHAIRLGRREAKRLRYLAIPGVRHFAGK